jgi:hypothetical protein
VWDLQGRLIYATSLATFNNLTRYQFAIAVNEHYYVIMQDHGLTTNITVTENSPIYVFATVAKWQKLFTINNNDQDLVSSRECLLHHNQLYFHTKNKNAIYRLDLTTAETMKYDLINSGKELAVSKITKILLKCDDKLYFTASPKIRSFATNMLYSFDLQQPQKKPRLLYTLSTRHHLLKYFVSENYIIFSNCLNSMIAIDREMKFPAENIASPMGNQVLGLSGAITCSYSQHKLFFAFDVLGEQYLETLDYLPQPDVTNTEVDFDEKKNGVESEMKTQTLPKPDLPKPLATESDDTVRAQELNVDVIILSGGIDLKLRHFERILRLHFSPDVKNKESYLQVIKRFFIANNLGAYENSSVLTPEQRALFAVFKATLAAEKSQETKKSNLSSLSFLAAHNSWLPEDQEENALQIRH